MKILRMKHKKKCLCASESTPEVVQNVVLDLLPSLLKNPPAFHKPPATNPPLLPRPLHSHFLPMTARFISPHSSSGLAAQRRHCSPQIPSLAPPGIPSALTALYFKHRVGVFPCRNSQVSVHRPGRREGWGPGRRSGFSLGF